MKNGLVLIGCYPMGYNGVTTLLNIINVGQHLDGVVTFETKGGTLSVPIDNGHAIGEINKDNFIKVVSPNELDVTASMRLWQIQNPHHYGFTIVVDDTLTRGERYHHFKSVYHFLVDVTPETIRVRPIWE